MVERGQLEVEVAVARGQELLVRVVFRPPGGFSIGSSAAATITIPDSPLPDRVELLAFVDGCPELLFFEDSRLEVDAEGERLSVRDLLKRGMAKPDTGHHVLPLAEGVRAVVILGALKVLVKVRMALDVSVWNLETGELGACGGCKSPVLWSSSVGPGALTPCPECGDLNRLRPDLDETAPPKPEQDLVNTAPSEPESTGPDTAAFDDDEEATELESLLSSTSGPIEQLPGSVEPEVEASAPPPSVSAAEEETPTDPGRDVPVLEDPVTLPAQQVAVAQDVRSVRSPTPTVAGSGFTADQEPSVVPDVPLVADGVAPTGNEFLAPRRRRPPPKPDYKAWGLVFFGMVSGLTGLLLLLLSALKL